MLTNLIVVIIYIYIYISLHNLPLIFNVICQFCLNKTRKSSCSPNYFYFSFSSIFKLNLVVLAIKISSKQYCQLSFKDPEKIYLCSAFTF